MKNRWQRGGDNSTNIQGEVVRIGPSYTEVRQIALDIYKSNAMELSALAAERAQARAEELVDDFILKLQETNPEGADSISEPDMQYSVFAAARDYARTNISEHRDMLSSLLVEKTRTPSESLESIAISEAVEAVRKISIEGADTLTAIFCLVRVGVSVEFTGIENCVEWAREIMFPWMRKMSDSAPVHDSLAHAGCLRPDNSRHYNLRNIFTSKFPAVFHTGFSDVDVNEDALSKLWASGYAEPIGDGRSKLNIYSPATIRAAAESLGDASLEEDIRFMLQQGMTSDDDLRQQLREADPQFGLLFESFDAPPMESAFLTNVGVAVAHANWVRVEPSAPPLNLWLSS